MAGEGLSPTIPKSFVVATVPCFRRLIPGEVLGMPVFVLPAVVLPLMILLALAKIRRCKQGDESKD